MMTDHLRKVMEQLAEQPEEVHESALPQGHREEDWRGTALCLRNHAASPLIRRRRPWIDGARIS